MLISYTGATIILLFIIVNDFASYSIINFTAFSVTDKKISLDHQKQKVLILFRWFCTGLG